MLTQAQFPFVSVIIPTYNEERYVEQCLASVIAQDWPMDRMEILVVDNGSTDATRAVAERVLTDAGCGQVLEKIGGTIGAVRNHGWRHARGEILAFLDGDSVVESHWLKVGHELLHSALDIACVGFAVAPPRHDDSWVERTWYPISSSGKHHGTIDVSWLSSFNMIIRKKPFETIGGFDESLVTCEDADLGARLKADWRLILSDRCYVQHMGNAKTVIEFIRKELWRGQNSLAAWLRAENKWKGSLSVFVPAIYAAIAFSFLTIFAASLLSKLDFGLVGLFFSLTFVIPFALAVRSGIRRPLGLISTATLYSLYLLARGVAIVSLRR